MSPKNGAKVNLENLLMSNKKSSNKSAQKTMNNFSDYESTTADMASIT